MSPLLIDTPLTIPNDHTSPIDLRSPSNIKTPPRLIPNIPPSVRSSRPGNRNNTQVVELSQNPLPSPNPHLPNRPRPIRNRPNSNPVDLSHNRGPRESQSKVVPPPNPKS